MNKYLKIIYRILLYGFAAIGLVFTLVFLGMQVGAFNVRGSILERNSFFGAAPSATVCADAAQTTCAWNQTPEWAVVAGGLTKDAAVIKKVSAETGVPERLIAAVVVPEQLRFFTSEREVFKRYFEPLKILGSLSQFSLGVSGIKQETANDIEKNANDPASLFYPGPAMAPLIAYSPGELSHHEDTLYNRLTDPKDHYYSYLYTALYLKEVEAQWQKSGIDISKNPAIVGTLFNIGFANSKPHPAPQTGGAAIAIGGTTYLFGELAADFYNSGELTDIFPK